MILVPKDIFLNKPFNHYFMKLALKKILGVVLIIMGIIGLFVPILQGIALIIVGIVLLEYEPLTEFMRSLKEKWKKRRKR